MNKQDGGIADMASFEKRFWRDSPEARRKTLLPFVWSVVARHGQIYGNRWKGSEGASHQWAEVLLPGIPGNPLRFRRPAGSAPTRWARTRT